MANYTVTNILREDNIAVAVGGIVKPVYTIIGTHANAGKVLSVMDLVGHYGHVDGIAAVGVGRAGIVAGNAILHLETSAAMQRQVSMTSVAGTGLGDLAGKQSRRRVIGGAEVINRVAQCGETPYLEADAMRQGWHITHG